MDWRQRAEFAFDSHAARHPLDDYPALLSLFGLARLAVRTGDARLLGKARAQLLPWARGEREPRSRNFENYRCGGLATAFLLYAGHLPEAREAVRASAGRLVAAAPRSPEGIFCMPSGPRAGGVWIDAAFAVTPFLLFSGLAHREEAWITEACHQTSMMVNLLRDPANGLLHQCRGFRGPGLLSEDHWSRGNGWGLLALAELAEHLPEGHPRRPEVEELFRGLLSACLAAQDPAGLWHQELTLPASYIETSGSGLILYALGVALERGLVAPDRRDGLERGLRELTGYVTPAGDVFHACRGCLCPGEGRIADYIAWPPVRNDPHGYGPLVLAFGQAHHLGLAAAG